MGRETGAGRDKRGARLPGLEGSGTGLRQGSRGFSLLELLTVLLMLGIMAGVAAPSLGRMLSGLDFRKQVGNVLENLRTVRLEAVVRGEDIIVSVDEHALLTRTYAGEPQQRGLAVETESILTMEPDTVIFTPQSTVTPATLTFSMGDRSRTIVLDPLTALPVVQ